MFYRQGGGSKYLSQQQDTVYTDTVGGCTAWLPVSRGNWLSVNACRASINFNTPVQSVVIKSPIAPEAEILLEQKQFGGEKDVEAWPTDRWQNMLVASGRRINFDGYVRLRVLNINTLDGMGVALGMQVNRTGDSGVDV